MAELVQKAVGALPGARDPQDPLRHQGRAERLARYAAAVEEASEDLRQTTRAATLPLHASVERDLASRAARDAGRADERTKTAPVHRLFRKDGAQARSPLKLPRRDPPPRDADALYRPLAVKKQDWASSLRGSPGQSPLERRDKRSASGILHAAGLHAEDPPPLPDAAADLLAQTQQQLRQTEHELRLCEEACVLEQRAKEECFREREAMARELQQLQQLQQRGPADVEQLERELAELRALRAQDLREQRRAEREEDELVRLRQELQQAAEQGRAATLALEQRRDLREDPEKDRLRVEVADLRIALAAGEQEHRRELARLRAELEARLRAELEPGALDRTADLEAELRHAKMALRSQAAQPGDRSEPRLELSAPNLHRRRSRSRSGSPSKLLLLPSDKADRRADPLGRSRRTNSPSPPRFEQPQDHIARKGSPKPSPQLSPGKKAEGRVLASTLPGTPEPGRRSPPRGLGRSSPPRAMGPGLLRTPPRTSRTPPRAGSTGVRARSPPSAPPGRSRVPFPLEAPGAPNAGRETYDVALTASPATQLPGSPMPAPGLASPCALPPEPRASSNAGSPRGMRAPRRLRGSPEVPALLQCMRGELSHSHGPEHR